MTAIEWLINQLEREYNSFPWINSEACIIAKEMENIQLQKAIEYGYQLRNNNKPINSGIDWVEEFKSLNKQTMNPQEKAKKYKYIFKHKRKDIKIILHSTDVSEAIMQLGSILNSVVDWDMKRFKEK